MKVKDLFEDPPPPKFSNTDMPVFRDGLSTPTLRGLMRENRYLGRYRPEQYDFWLTDGNGRALVTTPTKPIDGFNDINDYDPESTQTIITTLLFKKDPAEIPVPNKLQVDGVSTVKEYRAKFVAGYLYLYLVSMGFNIISDDYQFKGGKGLWKSLARKADEEKCDVRIWDERSNDWIYDDDGLQLIYTVNNLEDDKIWTDKFSDKTTLFVLSKRVF